MKPASRTVSYVVYPPNYVPGDGYVIEKTLKAAERRCRKKGFGIGSDVVRFYQTKNKRGGSTWNDPRQWTYTG